MARRTCLLAFSAPIALLAASLAIAQPDPERRSAAGPPAGPIDAPAEEQPAEERPKAEKTPLQKFMRVKLRSADLVLEGLVTGKFDLVQKGAGEFQQVSQADQWRASNDAMYRQHSREFQAKVKDLREAAQDKDIDRTTLAWIDTTLSCVECHKWVNAMLIARRPAWPAPRIPGLDRVSPTSAQRRGGSDHFAVFTAAPAAPGAPRSPAAIRPGEPAAAPEQAVSRFMREKLASAQDVLEGVLVEDFRLVTAGARSMSIMSQAAEWNVFDTPQYREDSTEFRAKCRQLLKAADEQRTDAAALAYVQLTLSCVRCHQHLHESRVAAGDPPKPLKRLAAALDR